MHCNPFARTHVNYKLNCSDPNFSQAHINSTTRQEVVTRACVLLSENIHKYHASQELFIEISSVIGKKPTERRPIE